MTLILATTNPRKVREAKTIFDEFSIKFEQKKLDIEEIQHHDPTKITEAKVRAAFTEVKKPVVVNDSSWEIPALNGFPSGYMKDVQQWFTAGDWLNLMRDKENREIILHERVGFFDGEILRIFSYELRGKFLEKPSEADGGSMEKLVQLDGDSGALAEHLEKMWQEEDSRPKHCDQWCEFAEWYVKEYKGAK
jgi:XTP/dITP diphosphohydrolase